MSASIAASQQPQFRGGGLPAGKKALVLSTKALVLSSKPLIL